MLKGEKTSRENYDLNGSVSVYAPELLPAMQSILQVLADLDFEHERDIERLMASETHPELKRQIKAKLDERFARRREPYVQHLSNLQSKALSITLYRESREERRAAMRHS